MFFERVNLLSAFYHALANRQSVSLVGPRGIGKSSFLYCASQPEMQARFPVGLSHHVFVLLDLHEYIYKTREEFFHDVCKEIKRHGQRFDTLSLHSDLNLSMNGGWSFEVGVDANETPAASTAGLLF